MRCTKECDIVWELRRTGIERVEGIKKPWAENETVNPQNAQFFSMNEHNLYISLVIFQ